MYGWTTFQLAQQTSKHDWFEELTALTCTMQFWTDQGFEYLPTGLRYRLVNPAVADLTNWVSFITMLNNAVAVSLPSSTAQTALPATRIVIPGLILQNPIGAPEERELLIEISDSTLPAGSLFYARKLFTVFRQDFLNDMD